MPRIKKAQSVAAARKAQTPTGLYRFAALVVAGEDPAAAAQSVGSDLDTLAYSPELHVAMVAALHREIAINHAPAALKKLSCLLTSNDERVVLNASKTILEYALPVGASVSPGETAGKPMETLSTAELQAMVERLEHELADRARPVVQQDMPDTPPQAFDFMD